MYEFVYDYIKPKCQNNVKLCYIVTDHYIKTKSFYEHIANDIENGSDACSYEINKPYQLKKKLLV